MEISKNEIESLKKDVNNLNNEMDKTKNDTKLILNILKLLKKSLDENFQELANAVNEIYKSHIPNSSEAISIINERLIKTEKSINTIGLYLKMANYNNNVDYDNNIEDIIDNMKSTLNMDDILDKISSDGFENLSKEEKKFLSNKKNKK